MPHKATFKANIAQYILTTVVPDILRAVDLTEAATVVKTQMQTSVADQNARMAAIFRYARQQTYNNNSVQRNADARDAFTDLRYFCIWPTFDNWFDELNGGLEFVNYAYHFRNVLTLAQR